jgi:hypothetical protein
MSGHGFSRAEQGQKNPEGFGIMHPEVFWKHALTKIWSELPEYLSGPNLDDFTE